MSQVYSTEPQTSGQVVFETTHGPISIHLWCKECPYTTRYFLQLCIDGYYNNLIFHRIVPNFLIQTGDAHYRQPQNQQQKQQSSSSSNINDDPYRQPPPPRYREQHNSIQAYERRRYELNSRIRFNHRGQIAMAIGIEDDDTNNNNTSRSHDDYNDSEVPRLQPQFFITLDTAAHLDGKHVCFGGVSGPTIFNALRMGQTDVYEEGEGQQTGSSSQSFSLAYQPRLLHEAPRILRTKVISVDLPSTVPPLVPTIEPPILPWNVVVDPNGSTTTDGNKNRNDVVDGTQRKKKKVRKGVKNVNLLSFGNDEELVDDEDVNDDDSDAGNDNNDDDNGKKKKKKSKIQSSHDVLASMIGNNKKGSRLVNHIDEELERRLLQTENIKEVETAGMILPEMKSQRSMEGGIEDDEVGPSTDPAETADMDDDKVQPLKPKYTNQSPYVEGPIAEMKSTNVPDAKTSTKDNKSTRTSPDNNDYNVSSIINNNNNKPPKKMSLVEARRAKYTNKMTTTQPKTKDDKQQREVDTMAKFQAFQQKIISQQATASGGDSDKRKSHSLENLDDNNDDNDNIVGHHHHNKRSDHKKKKKRRKTEDGGRGREIDSTGYHGQVLEMDTDEEDDGAWIQTKFKCKKHMDVNAKTGGDGRSMDDYVVLEERSSATDRKPDRKKSNSYVRL